MNIFKWVTCQFTKHDWEYTYNGMFVHGYTCSHCGRSKYDKKQ